MKATFFVSLLLAWSATARAQFLPLLETLEGHWVDNTRTGMMDWTFADDDNTVTGRLYQLSMGDTVVQLEVRILCDGPAPVMTLFQAGQIHTFRLERSLPYEQDWHNADPAATPRELHLQRYPGSRAVVVIDDQESLFRRKNRPGIRIAGALQAGLNSAVITSPRVLPGQTISQNYGWRQGYEAAFILGISFPKSAFGLDLEIGRLQYRYTADKSQTIADVTYHLKGLYELSSPYLGIAPQMYLGRRQAWKLTAGCNYLLRPRRDFSGTYSTTGTGVPIPNFLQNEKPQRAPLFFAGMLYAPTLSKAPWLRPGIYARVVGLPVRGGLRALTAGIRIGI